MVTLNDYVCRVYHVVSKQSDLCTFHLNESSVMSNEYFETVVRAVVFQEKTNTVIYGDIVYFNCCGEQYLRQG